MTAKVCLRMYPSLLLQNFSEDISAMVMNNNQSFLFSLLAYLDPNSQLTQSYSEQKCIFARWLATNSRHRVKQVAKYFTYNKYSVSYIPQISTINLMSTGNALKSHTKFKRFSRWQNWYFPPPPYLRDPKPHF